MKRKKRKKKKLDMKSSAFRCSLIQIVRLKLRPLRSADYLTVVAVVALVVAAVLLRVAPAAVHRPPLQVQRHRLS